MSDAGDYVEDYDDDNDPDDEYEALYGWHTDAMDTWDSSPLTASQMASTYAMTPDVDMGRAEAVPGSLTVFDALTANEPPTPFIIKQDTIVRRELNRRFCSAMFAHRNKGFSEGFLHMFTPVITTLESDIARCLAEFAFCEWCTGPVTGTFLEEELTRSIRTLERIDHNVKQVSLALAILTRERSSWFSLLPYDVQMLIVHAVNNYMPLGTVLMRPLSAHDLTKFTRADDLAALPSVCVRLATRESHLSP